MATSPADIAAPPSRPTQYSLRGVLLLTAAVAGACALGSWLGASWLPLLFGMTLYLANYLGMLGFMQGRCVAQTALYLAAGAWAMSFFLPVIHEYSGWTVAWICIWDLGLPEVRTYGITFNFAGRLFLQVAGLIVMGVTDLANLGMALCPLFAHRLVKSKARWLRNILAVSTPVVWIWYLAFTLGSEDTHFHKPIALAYLLWCGALTITAVVLRISRWQLVAATAMSLLLALGVWAWMDWLRSLP